MNASEERRLLVGEEGGELRLVRNVLLRHMHGGAPVCHDREGVVEYYGGLYVLGLLFLRVQFKPNSHFWREKRRMQGMRRIYE